MSLNNFQCERLACAWFFGNIGLVYGIFTARMPAFKAMTGASDGWIGFLLLAFGGSSFFGLLAARAAIDRFGVRRVMVLSALIYALAMIIASLAPGYWYLLVFCAAGGMANGFCDVAINAQGIIIERRHNALCMSSLHACFSLGGVLGSLSGSLFAALKLSPFANYAIVCGAYLFLWPWALRNTAQDAAPARIAAAAKGKLPFFVYFLGLMCMCCYVSEGSVGEWGSVLLHSAKNASQQEAALVYACFCSTMVIGRFFGDCLRDRFGDFRIVFFGSLLAGCSMGAVLLSPWPALCLCAYAAMGVGFAAIVPIFYSLSGGIPGLSPGRASAAVSLLAYTGMLVFPPFLGMLGDAIGLNNALWVIAAACFCVTCSCFFMRSSLNLKK